MEDKEKEIKKDIEEVANSVSNAEKLAWRRKYKRMEKLIEEVKPFEEKILNLIVEKRPIMDKIQKLRETMVIECIHPKDQLVHKETHLECKFCGKLISLKNGN